jgi:outer membrane lipoprotein-sorting protein
MSTHGIRIVALSFIIFLCPHGAHAQDISASDVLKKITETYRQVSSFSIVAERKVELDTDVPLAAYGADKVWETGGGSQQSANVQVTMIASGSSKAKLLLKDGKKEIVVVSNGKVVWTLLPAQHEYTELTASSANLQAPVYILRLGSNDISGADLLREYETLVAGRFQSTSNYGSWAKLEPSETLKIGKEKKECYVLTIQVPGTAQKQKLWVDKTEFTIWKSVDTTSGLSDKPGATLKTTVTTTIKQLAINPPLDDSNFVFMPPDRAKKVASLKLSGRNAF